MVTVTVIKRGGDKIVMVVLKTKEGMSITLTTLIKIVLRMPQKKCRLKNH